MNASVAVAGKDQSDARFFSQRAKHISLLSGQTTPVVVKPPPATEVRFQFSNRTYVPIKDNSAATGGPGHGSSSVHESRQSISVGRGRTAVPLSAFVLQKDNLSSSATVSTISTPVFVMHDEVEFVRPYFGPRRNDDLQSSALTSHKREVLLSALKEIESGLKTL